MSNLIKKSPFIMSFPALKFLKRKKPVVVVADTEHNQQQAKRLIALAKKQNLNPIIGGAFEEGVVRINISENEAKKFLSIALENCAEDDGYHFLYKENKRISRRKLKNRGEKAAYDIAITLHSSSSHEYVSLIQIAIWREINRYGRKFLSVNRPSKVISRVSDFDVFKDYNSIEEINGDYLDPRNADFPIDVVFTWVDGNDSEWRKEKSKYADLSDEKIGAVDERFKSRDELKYALRSIEMFMPFVRKVFIVTANQTPNWLNEDYSRVEVISHKDIFPNDEDLPTFNSHSIESHLHEIEGLSEHFVYFNDDMMVGKMAQRTDFFDANGISKVYEDTMFVVPELLSKDDHSFIRSSARVVELFRRDFSVSPTSMIKHVPYAVRRSIMKELQQRYSEEFSVTSSNRFRKPDDVPPISFFYSHYAMITGKAVSCIADHRYIPLFSPILEKTLNEQMRVKRRKKYICLNDAAVPKEKAESVDRIVRSFLSTYFPIKSKFEK